MSESIILASGSPRRKEILMRHKVSFEVIKSDAEEVITKSEPDSVVKELSRQKAFDVAGKLSGEEKYILAADTVVAKDNKILGKPQDEEDAFNMLKHLQGDVHEVYTGVTLLRSGSEIKECLNFAEVTKVYVYPMSDEEIRSYIATKEPMDKAGAYGIQGCFAIHIKGIEGDYDNVVGLPVARFYQECKEKNINIF